MRKFFTLYTRTYHHPLSEMYKSTLILSSHLTLTSRVVSSIQIFKLKFCMNFLFLPSRQTVLITEWLSANTRAGNTWNCCSLQLWLINWLSVCELEEKKHEETGWKIRVWWRENLNDYLKNFSKCSLMQYNRADLQCKKFGLCCPHLTFLFHCFNKFKTKFLGCYECFISVFSMWHITALEFSPFLPA